MSDMKDKLSAILASVLELEPSEIRDDLTPAQVAVWDSFTHVMLVTNIEEAFDIKIAPSEAMSITCVADFCSILRKRGIGD